MSVDQWATYADASTLVGVPEATLRQWKRRGVVASTMIRRTIHVDLADVRRAERSVRLHGRRPGLRRADLKDARQDAPEVSH